MPESTDLAALLRTVYTEGGAYVPLAKLELADAARVEDPAERAALLTPVARRLLDVAALGYEIEGLAPLALEIAEQVRALRPDDLEATAAYSEALAVSGRLDEALTGLRELVAPFKGKRSREAGAAYHALYRVEVRAGNGAEALEALTRAQECQPTSPSVALELGRFAMQLQQLEIAQRALRSVTLMKVDGGGPSNAERALSFLLLGDIAMQQGDARRGRMMYDKALSEDATLEDARARIASLG
jgi:tetratricopeptide (TPR) repeat protein